MPAVPAEDGTMIGTRVPRRFPVGDGEETVLVPRPGSAGPLPGVRVASAPGKAGDVGGGETGRSVPLIERRSVRAAYSVAAALITAVAVVLIFVFFSSDEPDDPARVRQADVTLGAIGPRAAPTITLPGRPRLKVFKTLPGTPSPVLGSVTDAKAAITYSKLGKPWMTGAIPPFSVGQRVGTVRLPRTMVASGLLPGATPVSTLKTDADFRKAALGAVKWTIINHYPVGSKVAWTASQKPVAGKGWALGYQVTYQVRGERRSSQAALALLDVGRRKPAMLFMTVPDTRKELWADIAPLVESARAL
ncbi:hypothetical protein [Streptosporangium sp. NPDC000396]|uniref:hypothetical protein n=1 Tax=Streptosporangium sp. NPDC000396 TaxID=3366185 RepID=UPI0036CFDCB1